MRILIIALTLVVLSGCSGYQLASRSQNISVESLSPKSFTVNFCGNAYMSQKEVDKYALQRASEVTLVKGYPYFAVMSKKDNSEVCVVNPENTYSSAMSSTGRRPSSYDFPSFRKPNVTLAIQCFAKGEKMPDGAINAEEYLNENFPGLKR